MREVIATSAFKKDYKRLQRSGHYAMQDLQDVVNSLTNDTVLSEKQRDHALTGNWHDCRECHIKSDWLLIYQLKIGELVLVRTGSHSDLF